MAWTYDFVANFVSVGMWNEWVSSVINELPGDTILELGHGPGHLQAQLSDQGKNVVGIDLSRFMGKLTQHKLRRNSLKHQLINAESNSIPLASNRFNHVVATFPTEYIYTNTALSEILRVLIPGGSLIILPVAWIKPQGLFKRAAAWLFNISGQAGEWNDNFLTPFKAAGFDVESKNIELPASIVLHITATKPITTT